MWEETRFFFPNGMFSPVGKNRVSFLSFKQDKRYLIFCLWDEKSCDNLRSVAYKGRRNFQRIQGRMELLHITVFKICHLK
ncbi:MAG: hypothetical protein DRI57_33170 [Deltaproteobacteria bacterium]|nr:MAG: hypothetical protein DRI57_33170 [Deltaproteobacteria bacterium]